MAKKPSPAITGDYGLACFWRFGLKYLVPSVYIDYKRGKWQQKQRRGDYGSDYETILIDYAGGPKITLPSVPASSAPPSPTTSSLVGTAAVGTVVIAAITVAQHAQLLNVSNLVTNVDRFASKKDRDEQGLDAWFDQFEISLKTTSDRLFAIDELDKKHSIGHFIAVCEGAARKSIGAIPWLAAVLATGQINYSELFVDGYSVSLGLSEYNIGREIKPDGEKQNSRGVTVTYGQG